METGGVSGVSDPSAPASSASVQGKGRRQHAIDPHEISAQIERLLGEIQSMAGPPTWQRVEELVSRLMGLYGAGLARVMHHAAGQAEDEGHEGTAAAGLVAALCDDEVVSSLLLLHGLHPVPIDQRIHRALERVRPYLGSHAGGVELLGIDADAGTVRLRLLGTCRGCPSSRATIESTLRRAIEDAAPEFASVEVEGEPERSAAGAGSGLVSLRTDRTAADAASSESAPLVRWVPLDGIEALPPGGRRMVQMGALPVAIFRVGEVWLAYRNACAGCGARLDGARVDDDGVLECAGCRRRFELTRAGRALEGGAAAPLNPLPLLVSESEPARIAVPIEDEVVRR